MRILICTPLYPPDIEPSAQYVQELAIRLASADHTVTVLAYGELLEPTPGVMLYAVPKDVSLLMRLMRYAHALMRLQKQADAVICENGPSVELPFLLASFFTHVRRIVHDGDARASAIRKRHVILNSLHRAARSRAVATLVDTPLPRPEILPFTPQPAGALVQYEASWVRHLDALTQFLI